MTIFCGYGMPPYKSLSFRPQGGIPAARQYQIYYWSNSERQRDSSPQGAKNDNFFAALESHPTSGESRAGFYTCHS
ncbi:MAG: hypothetical protein WBG94_03205, partial [Anaerolineales bacterium]